jgi:hypothetical protein
MACHPPGLAHAALGAVVPATVTSASTRGSTNRPTAAGFGVRTIRYRAIAARIQASTSSDSKTVVSGISCALQVRLTRYAVWTSQPRAVSATVRYHRASPRTTNRDRSLIRARP